MASIKDVYCKIATMHEALNRVNSGDQKYHQFYYFRSINGDSCKMLAPLALGLPIEFIEKDLDELVRVYTEYKQAQLPRDSTK